MNIPQVDVDAKAARFVSPRDTKGWQTRKEAHIEVFISATGEEYVRAHPREVADVIITFERLGTAPIRLVRYASSSVMRRARRAVRKAGKRTAAKRKR